MHVEELMKKQKEDYGFGVEELMDGLTLEDNKKINVDKEFLEPLPISNTGKKNVKLDKENKNSKTKENNEAETKTSQLKSKRNRQGEEIMTSSNDEDI